jgi:hypothetical protein
MDETSILRTGQATDACDGSMCSSGRAGHAILDIQRRVASASPSAWRDAFVTAASGGMLTLELFDGSTVRLWSHSELDVVVGEPVAWHPVAETVAVAGQHLSAARR